MERYVSIYTGEEIDERLSRINKIEQILLGYISEDVANMLSMEIDVDGDNLVALGEVKTIRCKVFRGFVKDVTSDIITWKVERISSDPVSDISWNAYRKSDGTLTKSGQFSQQSKVDVATIDITWSNNVSENDIDNDAPSTRFKFTGSFLSGEGLSAILEI